MYRTQVGEESLRILGSWLASTLIWLPLFIPVLGLRLGLTPPPRVSVFGLYVPPWVEIIILAWLLTGWSGEGRRPASDAPARGFPAAFALLLAGIVAISMMLMVAGGIGVILVMGLVAGGAAVAAIIIIHVLMRGMATVVASGVAGGIAVGVIIGVAFAGITGLIRLRAGGVGIILGVGVSAVAVGVAVMMIAGDLEEAVQSGRSSVWSRFLFGGLVLAYAFLIWVYLLGGWRTLYPV